MSDVKVYLGQDKDYEGAIHEACSGFYSDIVDEKSAYLLILYHNFKQGGDRTVQVVHGHDIQEDFPEIQKSVPSDHWSDLWDGLNRFKEILYLQETANGYAPTQSEYFDVFNFPDYVFERVEQEPEKGIHDLENFIRRLGNDWLEKLDGAPREKCVKIPFIFVGFDNFPGGPRPSKWNSLQIHISFFLRNGEKDFFEGVGCLGHSWLDTPEVRQLLSSRYLPDILYGYDIMAKTHGFVNDPAAHCELFGEFFLKHLTFHVNGLYKLFIGFITSRALFNLEYSGGAYTDNPYDVEQGDILLQKIFLNPLLCWDFKELLTPKEVAYLEKIMSGPVPYGRLLSYILLPQLYPEKYGDQAYRAWANDPDEKIREEFAKSLPDEAFEVYAHGTPATKENLVSILELQAKKDYQTIIKKYLRSPDPATRALTILGLVAAQDKGNVDKVDPSEIDSLFYDESPLVRKTALKYVLDIYNIEKYSEEEIDNLLRGDGNDSKIIRLSGIKKYLQLVGPTARALKWLIPHMDNGCTTRGGGGNFLFWWHYCNRGVEKCEGCLEIILSMLEDKDLRRHAIVAMIWIGRPEHLPLLKELYPSCDKELRRSLRGAIKTLEGDVDGLMKEFRRIRSHGMIKGLLFKRVVEPALERARKFRAERESQL